MSEKKYVFESSLTIRDWEYVKGTLTQLQAAKEENKKLRNAIIDVDAELINEQQKIGQLNETLKKPAMLACQCCGDSNLLVLSSESFILKQAIDKFGAEHQIIIAIEELSELQKELTKELRYSQKSLTIAEEMADVEIILQELKMIFGNEKEVEGFRIAKVKRLEKLINK